MSICNRHIREHGDYGPLGAANDCTDCAYCAAEDVKAARRDLARELLYRLDPLYMEESLEDHIAKLREIAEVEE